MAWHGSDGKGGSKAFTNKDAASGYERRMGAGKVASAVAAPQKAEFGQEGGDWGEEEEQDPQAVVEAHGPAHEVHITHDHAANRHEVHSMHEDGYEHHSEHGSVNEAHEHGRKLAGGDSEVDGEGGGEVD